MPEWYRCNDNEWRRIKKEMGAEKWSLWKKRQAIDDMGKKKAKVIE